MCSDLFRGACFAEPLRRLEAEVRESRLFLLEELCLRRRRVDFWELASFNGAVTIERLRFPLSDPIACHAKIKSANSRSLQQIATENACEPIKSLFPPV